jgi:hypothetical protein
MEQLRLGFPSRDAGNSFSRLLLGAGTLMVGLAVAAVAVLVVLPVLGIIVSAAVGGAILALAGVVMMVPLILVTGAVLALLARNNLRKPGPVRARRHWR